MGLTYVDPQLEKCSPALMRIPIIGPNLHTGPQGPPFYIANERVKQTGRETIQEYASQVLGNLHAALLPSSTSSLILHYSVAQVSPVDVHMKLSSGPSLLSGHSAADYFLTTKCKVSLEEADSAWHSDHHYCYIHTLTLCSETHCRSTINAESWGGAAAAEEADIF
ncbi:hypothetical protein JOB18_032335 [Solea senegalensis]|uniref:Uncharacterized protein n=1 Tax=Solea senegalensis TaxID=28829 RepID=A0AAV6T8I1_SOLSE|nr:hypothetical protein JOB18_032335 [Solea senegalensis]